MLRPSKCNVMLTIVYGVATWIHERHAKNSRSTITIKHQWRNTQNSENILRNNEVFKPELIMIGKDLTLRIEY